MDPQTLQSRDPRARAIIGAAMEVQRELGCGFDSGNWVWVRLGAAFTAVAEKEVPTDERSHAYVGLEHMQVGGGLRRRRPKRRAGRTAA